MKPLWPMALSSTFRNAALRPHALLLAVAVISSAVFVPPVDSAEHGSGSLLGGGSSNAVYDAQHLLRQAEQGYQPANERLEALEAKFTVPAETPSTRAAAAKSVAASGQSGSAAEWLAALDSTQYTLQLLSDKDESSVQRFVARNVDPKQGGYFSSRIKGDLWHSVVYGGYPDYVSAKNAVERLPVFQRNLKPWVRRVGLVQKQMLR